LEEGLADWRGKQNACTLHAPNSSFTNRDLLRVKRRPQRPTWRRLGRGTPRVSGWIQCSSRASTGCDCPAGRMFCAAGSLCTWRLDDMWGIGGYAATRPDFASLQGSTDLGEVEARLPQEKSRPRQRGLSRPLLAAPQRRSGTKGARIVITAVSTQTLGLLFVRPMSAGRLVTLGRWGRWDARLDLLAAAPNLTIARPWSAPRARGPTHMDTRLGPRPPSLSWKRGGGRESLRAAWLIWPERMADRAIISFRSGFGGDTPTETMLVVNARCK
jgi:hypothetical protein